MLALALGMALGLPSVGCNGSSCGDGDSHSDGFSSAYVDVVLVDAVTRLRICSAELSCSSCPDVTAHGCDYAIPGFPGSKESVTISAPGFTAASFEIVFSSACNGAAPAPVTRTIALTPACPRPTVHGDGLGQSWPDCTAAGTYGSSEATTACAYYTPTWTVSTYCANTTCSMPDGGAIPAVCTAENPFSDSGPNKVGECVCWGYEGSAAGHVRLSAGCECPGTSDPSWQ